jgi:hypothetical protein
MFSTIDLRSGYYQIRIAERTKKRPLVAQGMVHTNSW